MTRAAFDHRDDGTRNIPGQNSDWRAWVNAARTRNFCNDDPLLDWLDEFGVARGFVPAHQSPNYDARTDFPQLALEKGIAFEAAVMRHLGTRIQLEQIAGEPSDTRDAATVDRTWDAMCAGTEAIAQAVLWNAESQTYGAADLLLRSDVLARLFPGVLSEDEARLAAPDVPSAGWHYRVVDVKFTTLKLLKNGHAGTQHLEYMAQVWLYNEALGRIQGFTPPAGYLLGRGWTQLQQRGGSAMERLARIDREHVLAGTGRGLRELISDACQWIRVMRVAGAYWSVLPAPTVDELRPNMRYTQDAPWHQAKQRVAAELEDLTSLPRVTPKQRRSAIARGIKRWADSECSAANVEIVGDVHISAVDAVIRANHSAADGPIVFPARVSANEHLWREPVAAEFYVDFETVSDLNDDFSAFPMRGGQPLIFMIGCGQLLNPRDPSSWSFRVFTADRLTEDCERQVITDWIEHVTASCVARGTTLADARLFHWSPAEVSTLTNAYNSAATRHGLPGWDALPWVDLLASVIKAEPVTVRGAFGFGLKAIAKAMHRAGLISTAWNDGPIDGLGAMVGAWWCDERARSARGSMRDLELMRSIETYNEVDCRVMADVLHFLRTQR